MPEDDFTIAGPDPTIRSLTALGVLPGSASAPLTRARERSKQPVMPFGPTLIGELAELTAALDDPDLDLAAGVEALGRRIVEAVTSYTGLMVEITGTEAPIGFTTLGPELVPLVRTSLTMTLPRTVPDAPAIELTLLASTPGAFVDLAADVSWLTSRHGASVVLDHDLDMVRPGRADTLQAASTVNQALGVLLGRGLVPDDARRELDALAERSGTDRVGAAEQLRSSVDQECPRDRL